MINTEGLFPSSFDKLALAVEATQVAKDLTVQSEGIGEDLNMNLFGWRGDKLAILVQLANTHRINKEQRMNTLLNGACLIRQGWGVDSITLVAEGFCSIKPSETSGQDLAKLFAEPDSPVKECLTFTHAETGNEDVIYITIPYSLLIGRKVSFDTPLIYPGGQVMRDLRYPAVLRGALRLGYEEPESEDLDTYYETLAEQITDNGFEVFYADAPE